MNASAQAPNFRAGMFVRARGHSVRMMFVQASGHSVRMFVQASGQLPRILTWWYGSVGAFGESRAMRSPTTMADEFSAAPTEILKNN